MTCAEVAPSFASSASRPSNETIRFERALAWLIENNSLIKRINQVWNCCGCFTVFHLQCIQKWARDGVALRQLHGTATEEKTEHWFW